MGRAIWSVRSGSSTLESIGGKFGVCVCAAFRRFEETTRDCNRNLQRTETRELWITPVCLSPGTSLALYRVRGTKTATDVDTNGKPVSIETVKAGLPVTVYYDKSGNKRVATKVVVTRTVPVDPHR